MNLNTTTTNVFGMHQKARDYAKASMNQNASSMIP
jgi:hypothetical protein